MPAGQAIALLLALEAAACLLNTGRPEELRSKTYMQTIFHPIWSCHYPSERNYVCQIYSAVCSNTLSQTAQLLATHTAFPSQASLPSWQ